MGARIPPGFVDTRISKCDHRSVSCRFPRISECLILPAMDPMRDHALLQINPICARLLQRILHPIFLLYRSGGEPEARTDGFGECTQITVGRAMLKYLISDFSDENRVCLRL